ncbi:hypothetical protein D7V86_19575 [bacterium D16-51]|nr:hypothetical protein D7V96_19795 [bacterium D16-59]RKI56569.1 hypothetical protein D7V86_19575 [bacterium D16-51]
MQKELIYEQMNGFLEEDIFSIPKEITIENEFAEGTECSQMYERAYLAKQNLCRRLGQEEDNDIEILISSMENIARLLSLKMYEYGRREH